MNRSAASGMAFLVIGVVFIAVWSSGQRAFIGVGAAFVAIGVVFSYAGTGPPTVSEDPRAIREKAEFPSPG